MIYLQSQIEIIAKRFNASPKFVATALNLRKAVTGQERLKVLSDEAEVIEQGEQASVRMQHDAGKLTIRERITRLCDTDSFEELDMIHRPYETGFDIPPDATCQLSPAVVAEFHDDKYFHQRHIH